MKIFTICDKCSTEIELQQEIYRKEIFTKTTNCPNCNQPTHKWIKVTTP